MKAESWRSTIFKEDRNSFYIKGSLKAKEEKIVIGAINLDYLHQ